jgi:hypothetical protein
MQCTPHPEVRRYEGVDCGAPPNGAPNDEVCVHANDPRLVRSKITQKGASKEILKPLTKQNMYSTAHVHMIFFECFCMYGLFLVVRGVPILRKQATTFMNKNTQ